MDSNQPGHTTPFSLPDNQARPSPVTSGLLPAPSSTWTIGNEQIVNPDSANRTFDLTGTSVNPSPFGWDANALEADPGMAGSPSTAPASLCLESHAQSTPSTAPTSLSMNTGAVRHSKRCQTGQMSATRTPRPKEAHQRKRSKLSTDANPFDSVDYWIQFDDEEEPLPAIPERADPSRPDPSLKGKPHSEQRSINPARHLPSVSRQAQPRPYKTEPYAEDSALDNALSEEDDEFSSINLADQLSKLDSLPPSDIPPREGLYSTPLSWEKPEPGPIFWENPDPGPFSWERPQPGLRMDSLTGLNSFVLSEAERRRLIAIAMNPGPSMGGLGSNLNLNFEGQDSRLDLDLGTGFSTGTMRQESHTVPQPKPPSQRRPAPPTEPKKSDNAGEKGKEKSRAGDRTAHNDIERKYRTNLKDKIAELRDAVPSLQTISEAGPEGGDSSRPARGPKVSKGTVLTKATEYIHHLEKRNRQIVVQHQELSRRLQAFQQLLTATASPTYQMPNFSRDLFDPRAFC